MKPQGQEEFDGHTAYDNMLTGELDSGPCSGPSPDTDSQGQGVPKDPLLFIQLNELLGWPQVLEWRETGRWVLFEEKLEVGGGRWSAPHVPTLALPSLQKLRSLLAEGLVLLDCPAQSLLELVEQVTRVESLSPELRGQLQSLLLQRPQHLIRTTGTRPCWGSAHPRESSHDEEAPLKEQRQNALRHKLPPGAEAGAVLAGELGFLAQPLGAFVRLQDPVVLGSLTEVPLPSRFFCLLLGPPTLGRSYHEMGRAMAVLLSDPQFQWSVRRASNLYDLLAALDAFLEEVTVLPPGRWDPTSRIPPPKCLPSQHKRRSRAPLPSEGPGLRTGTATRSTRPARSCSGQAGCLGALSRTCGGRPRGTPATSWMPCTPSASRLCSTFIWPPSQTPLLLGGCWEKPPMVLRGCWKVSWAQQWLELPSASWPASPSLSSAALGQCWSLNACSSTSAGNESQWTRTKPEDRDDILSMDLGLVNASLLPPPECVRQGGHPRGPSCHTVPDIAFFSLLLFLTSFLFAMALKHVKTSRFFPSVVRKVLSDFSSVLAILLGCGLDAFLGLATPKLMVPREFKPTLPGRDWLVSSFGTNPWWLSVAAALPALLLSILIFMDQQITAVILNRAEYRLRKGAGFHLDFFCVALLMLLTSALGLPWYVSATVISLAHMDSLRRESRACAPGEPPSFLGIREQRLTGLVVFILTGISIFLAPILKFIPMPVLYGIFLYMGVAAISSIQFTKRVQLLLMPAKHQPDLLLLRHVPLSRVHLFTAIQLACLGLLWIVKSTPAAIIFPIMLLGLVGVRKALEWVFSPQELLWLDELMPEKERSTPEKGLEPECSFSGSESEESELMYQPKAPEINISVN
ncbi:anion exchange protein 4 isoform X8 [Phyllostomus discolor]|uniref:Anion exchange protein 4 isoform X8 n=1 Tax=Phyllostomus discolor TaxID=89673 RepID=A0A7E6CT79_9CHIR|nr:anion exchange protein 4 isoform X8 [Phyllostomus discolor]